MLKIGIHDIKHTDHHQHNHCICDGGDSVGNVFGDGDVCMVVVMMIVIVIGDDNGVGDGDVYSHS